MEQGRAQKNCANGGNDFRAKMVTYDSVAEVKTPLKETRHDDSEAGPRGPVRKSAEKRRTDVIRLVVTGCLVLEFFRLALYQEILGPTLPYLRDRASTDFAAVTQAISGKAVGAVVGGVVGGLFADKFKEAWALVICVTQAVSAAWMAALPFVPHIGVYWASFVTMGFLEGAVNIFGQGVILRMWQARAAAPLHLLHFGFGCGSVLMPLIVSLFFPRTEYDELLIRTTARLNGSCVEMLNGSIASADLLLPTNTTRSQPAQSQAISVLGTSFEAGPNYSTSSEPLTSSLSTVTAEAERSSFLPSSPSPTFSSQEYSVDSPVRFAFVLLAGVGALCFLVFANLLIAARRGRLPMPSNDRDENTRASTRGGSDNDHGEKGSSGRPKMSDAIRLSSCLPHSKAKVALLLVAMVVFGAVVAAVDRTFGSFIFVYAKRELCFDDDTAVALNSAFWGAFTGGRVAGFLVAQHLHPRYFFLVEVAGLAASCIALGVFGGGDSTEVTWVFSLAAAFFLGPVFPSFLAWANRYIVVTGMAITVVLIGIAIGAASCITIVGQYIESHPAAVTYFAAGLAGTLLAVAGALQAVGSSLGDRFDVNIENQDKIMRNERVSDEELETLKRKSGSN